MLEMAKMAYTLSQHYEEKIRPCIDIIDNLRSLGVEKDLALPAIAVIGDQSSGKSSILEALSGVPLPRGSGIVTRCPLELKMIRSKDEDEWHGRISYQDHEEDFDDPAEVEKKIREAQDMMTGGDVGISEELISLQITSANVPDLTLIDLPGIARVAVNGQPEDIGDQIKKLIKKFVTKQETINLVVVPSNVDIATTEALRIAQEYDPVGERTLGILTKPDLVDKGTERTVVDIVHNKVFPLTKGYMIVKCRGQIEIVDRVSLKEATEAENKFFKDHPYFSNLFQGGFATFPKLAEKLTSELVYHIEKSLPQLKEQIEKKLAETEKELVPYSNGPPSDSTERLQFLNEKITDFTENVLNLTSGNVDACDSGQLIFPELRKVFAKWDGTLDHAKSMNDMKEEVENYEEKYRGKELPGFINYRTFESLICRKIMELEEPALGMLKTVSDMIRKSFINLARRSFNGFPNLLKTTRSKIEDIKLNKESLAENQVKTQFKMECVVYSQDGGYSQALKQSKEKSKENGQTKESEDNHASLDEMKFHLITYYTIVHKRLADQIPMVILYLLLQEAGKELRTNMSLLLNDKDGVDDLLKEDYDIGQKRERLLKRKQRLTKARDLLAKWETNI